VEVESATGLCQECLRTIHSPVSTPRNPLQPSIDLHAPTIDEVITVVPGPGEETHTHQPGAEPATVSTRAPARVPLPTAPAGYEILGELGLGGMGAVYLAREVVPDRLVAMKFLRRPGSQSAYDRFLVEVRALAALDHPNIIRVISTDFFRSDPFFTTEYFPNGSLLKRVDETGPLDPIEAARLMALAARAVHAANQRDVIHRDLKPSNILLTADGVPKVADFGLAKRLDQEDDLTTGTGALGSPPYMAPEQTGKRSPHGVDARTDVYGLGATLYHVVTGQRPFAGDTPEEVMSRLVCDPPPPPRSLRPEVPRDLEAIILKCLEKDPSRRYATGEALAEDLERLLSGQVPLAPPLTRLRRLRRWTGRNGWLAAKVAAASIIVGVLAAFALWPPWQKPNAEKTDAETVAEIQKQLKSGQPVILLGETGRPRYHRWPGDQGEFLTLADGTFAFRNSPDTLLELLPDPGIDRYRISLEICHVAAGAQRIGQTGTGQGGGLYFGDDIQVVPNDGGKLHAYFAVQTAEYQPNPAKPVPRYLSYDDRLLLHNPLVRGGGMIRNVTKIRCDPVPVLPGPWRRLAVELTPESIKLDFGPEFGGMRFVVHDADGLRERIARLQEDLADQSRAALVRGVRLAPWSPRRPFGVHVYAATIAVRNVLVTPLAPPKV
jgi:serine/threonine protein kinase